MNHQRKGMASVELLMLVAVSAIILMGLKQYWVTNFGPQTVQLVQVVLGQEESSGDLDTDFEISRPSVVNSNDQPLPEPKRKGGDRNFVDNLSIADAKLASDLAYSAGLGEKTKSGLEVVRVKELDSGFRVIVLKDPNNSDRPPVVAFAGTHTDKFGNFLRDGTTDFVQLLLTPEQYHQASSFVSELKEEYGDLVLTGHSLGGGLANYAGAMHGVPGLGINSAPLSIESQIRIAFHNPNGASSFVRINNEYDVVSARLVPGQQLGEIYESEGGWHSLGDFHVDSEITFLRENRLTSIFPRF